MPSLSAPASIHSAPASARSSPLPAVNVAARAQHSTQTTSHFMPAQPAAIPARSGEWESSSSSMRLPLQRELAIGSVDDPLEAEADTVAAQVMSTSLSAAPQASRAAPSLRRSASAALPSVEVPPIVHETLRSSGQPLDAETRAFMEPGIGHDLSAVRVHTGPLAAESARAVGALAYTVGQDTVFAAEQYDPRSREGRQLLAHELSHTVQQAGGGRSNASATAPVLQRQTPTRTLPQQSPPTDTSQDKPKTDEATVFFTWDDLLHAKLTPPSLLAPRRQGPLLPSPGTLTPGGSSGATPAEPFSAPFGFSPGFIPPGAFASQPPSLFTPPQSPIPPVTQPSPYFTPTPGQGSAGSSGAAPAAPSRLNLHDFGNLHVGLRLGFPDMKDDDKPGAPPSALQESIQKAEILNFMITGQTPSMYQIDPGKLVGAVWGIFSEKIAPDVARKIAAGMSSKPAGKGPSLELDATLLISTSSGKGGGPGGGGGLTATLRF